MMKEKGIALIKIARLLVGIVFVAGLISIALFPFDKRNLSLQFMTKEGKYEVIVNNDEIAQGKWQYIDFADGIKIEELRIYGKIKSMFLEKIKYDQFAGYIAGIENGEIRWEEDGLVLDGTDARRLEMNEAFGTLLKEHSSTLLLERLIMAELYAVMMAFILLALKIAEEKISNNNNNK